MMNSLKNRILFTDEYAYDKIKDLDCFNNFTNVKTDSKRLFPLPFNIKILIITAGYTSDFADIIFPHGLHTIDMNVLWDSEYPKISPNVKKLYLPSTIDTISLEKYQSYQSPFLSDMDLYVVGIWSSYLSKLRFVLPNKTTHLVLFGMRWLEKGDIPDHIANLYIWLVDISSQTLADMVPPTVKYLSFRKDVMNNDFAPFVKRDITISVTKTNQQYVDELRSEWAPNFCVEYID